MPLPKGLTGINMNPTILMFTTEKTCLAQMLFMEFRKIITGIFGYLPIMVFADLTLKHWKKNVSVKKTDFRTTNSTQGLII